jgi:hypothetical protein
VTRFPGTVWRFAWKHGVHSIFRHPAGAGATTTVSASPGSFVRCANPAEMPDAQDPGLEIVAIPTL